MSKRSFREIWLKPEVWPLIGSIGIAIGVCGAQMANKISQPGMTFSKSARKGGIFAQFEDIDEVKPALDTFFKSKSYSIFGSESEILDNNRTDDGIADQIFAVVDDVVDDVIDVVKDKVIEFVLDEAEEKLLEKGAELATQLKEIVSSSPTVA